MKKLLNELKFSNNTKFRNVSLNNK